jgi:hypothetical protein
MSRCVLTQNVQPVGQVTQFHVFVELVVAPRALFYAFVNEARRTVASVVSGDALLQITLVGVDVLWLWIFLSAIFSGGSCP